ncbi:MAG: hypothetical protein JW797_06060 [Bradymonadales bacterium]|nr:hypothetical protein [Bradymonadales bacterium]
MFRVSPGCVAVLGGVLWMLTSLVGLSGCSDGRGEGQDTPDLVSDQGDVEELDQGDPLQPDLVTGPTIGETTQSECLELQPEVGETIQSDCIAPPPAEIVVGNASQSECLGETVPYITPTEQSECLDEPALASVAVSPCQETGNEEPDVFRVVPGLGRIDLVHENASYNCCGLVQMTLGVDQNMLILTEEVIFDEEHPGCWCLCDYDLSAEITGLAEGAYTVRWVDGTTGERYGDDIPVTVAAPEPVFGAQGGPGRIDLWHDNAVHTCCVDVAMQYALDNGQVTVWEVESGAHCDCICSYDLDASIKGLAAGIYTVTLLDGPAGQPVGEPIEVTVSEGGEEIRVEVVEDTLTIQHLGAIWNCCGQVTMNVTLDADNGLILVEEVESAAEAGYPCRCLCVYDLSVGASGFPRGDYIVRVFTNHGEEYRIFGEVEVTVPGRPNPAGGEESISAQRAEANAILVTHHAATYNCCSEVAMVAATLTDSAIGIQEVITNDELCRCVCEFDLSVPVGRLVPGEVEVSVTSADGTVIGSESVTVIGEELPPWPQDTVELERSGSVLAVTHWGIEFMCCSQVAFQLEANGDILDLVEVVTNPEEVCFCNCHYELSASITGLVASQGYTVRIWTDRRTALLHQLAVPGE